MRTLTNTSNAAMQSLRHRLIALLQANDMNVDGELSGDTPLLTSGDLDSLNLFNLALFIESEIGHKVDITAFDLAKEWDTIDDILNFIARLRATG